MKIYLFFSKKVANPKKINEGDDSLQRDVNIIMGTQFPV